MLADASGAYQLAAAAAFVQALRPDTRARGFGRAQQAEAKAEAAPTRGRYERRLLTKLSAMELPSPPSSGMTIQAHR
jgi:hypothetical protein